MITFADRLWLAWKVLTGSLAAFRADSQSFSVTLDFTAQERMALGQRLDRNRDAKKSRTS